MTEVKPCPLCGPESFVVPLTRKPFSPDAPLWTAVVKCEDCGISLSRTDVTMELALEACIEAWNTRAERTCKMELNQLAGMYQCSECGEYSVTAAWQKKQGHLNWCAKCGAKVVCDD